MGSGGTYAGENKGKCTLAPGYDLYVVPEALLRSQSEIRHLILLCICLFVCADGVNTFYSEMPQYTRTPQSWGELVHIHCAFAKIAYAHSRQRAQQTWTASPIRGDRENKACQGLEVKDDWPSNACPVWLSLSHVQRSVGTHDLKRQGDASTCMKTTELGMTIARTQSKVLYKKGLVQRTAETEVFIAGEPIPFSHSILRLLWTSQ